MDPDVMLEQIRDRVSDLLSDNIYSGPAMRLAEQVEELDEWITQGGFLPAAWKQAQQQLEPWMGKAARSE